MRRRARDLLHEASTETTRTEDGSRKQSSVASSLHSAMLRSGRVKRSIREEEEKQHEAYSASCSSSRMPLSKRGKRGRRSLPSSLFFANKGSACPLLLSMALHAIRAMVSCFLPHEACRRAHASAKPDPEGASRGLRGPERTHARQGPWLAPGSIPRASGYLRPPRSLQWPLRAS